MFLAAASNTHAMILTMCSAIAIGTLLIVVARVVRFPAIVLLLVGGVVLGPEVLGDYALVKPEVLGDGLLVVVSIAVGLILFEGGLTLDLTGYRTAPTMIKRLLTFGIAITWFGVALAVWLLTDLPPGQAIITGSLVIVTGPTVIAPLLKRIRVNTKLHSILHWEGVLIDPIGVFIALLCFEFIAEGTGGAAFVNLALRFGGGLGIGAAGGFALTWLVKRKIVPNDMINAFALGFAVAIFGIAEAISAEAGLLAVTVAGFIFGLSESSKLKEVRHFKAEITDLLIGTLFLLLASRLSFDQFRTFGITGIAVVAIVLVVIRPVSIMVCSFGLDLSKRERLFLAWVAPRGIVAASMASLIAIRMEESGADNPKFVETFTYSVIIATIVLQGLTAGPLAKILDVKQQTPRGWLIVGAHGLGQRVARFVSQTAQLPVLLVDTNHRAVRAATQKGLNAAATDARDARALLERPIMHGVGNLLALTDNEDLNVRLCQIWADMFGPEHVFRASLGVGVANEQEEEAEGHIVWSTLPRPALLAAELERGELSVIEAGGDAGGFSQDATPVMAFDGDQIILDPSPDESAAASDPSKTVVLYLQRQADFLVRAVRPELVGPVDATDHRSLFNALLDRVLAVRPDIPRDEVLEDLMERERTLPSTLGHSVAVPHAYVRGLDDRLCVVAQAPEGIDLNAADAEPVRLVFMILSPQGDPEGHLAALAEVARLTLDDDHRLKLIAATTPAQALAVIRAARRQSR